MNGSEKTVTNAEALLAGIHVPLGRNTPTVSQVQCHA
jgi:hypothetical protein